MNLRLGRFGRQESACAVGIAALISGIFSVNVSDTFAQGNVCYMATAAGALLSLLLVRLVDGAMIRQGARELSDLLSGGLKALALPLVAGLVLSAALPLFRFTLAMERYIFVEADYVPIVLYLLPVLLLLVLRGMECVGRMAKLLLLPGDGIGPEVMGQVEKIVSWFEKQGLGSFSLERGLVGGIRHRRLQFLVGIGRDPGRAVAVERHRRGPAPRR